MKTAHSLLFGLVVLAVSATSFAGGVTREGRVLASTAMQEAKVARRVTVAGHDGVKTIHHIKPTHEVTEGVISRAGLRDPLVMHSSSVKSVRAGEAATFQIGTYEFAIPVSERALLSRIEEVLPAMRTWLRTRTVAPSSVGVREGKWVLEAGDKLIPVRPPLTDRRIDGTGVI